MLRPRGLAGALALAACTIGEPSDKSLVSGGPATATTTAASTGTHGSTSSGVGGTSNSGSSTGAALECDAAFAFSPDPPESASALIVSFTDPAPLAYVDLQTQGPGQASIAFVGISTENPWTWDYEVVGLAPGVWTFVFSAEMPAKEFGRCQVAVLDTGDPAGTSGGGGACAGKVCGDDDGAGGTCQTCPMVGSCLDPPSPYGPGGKESWACLDNAGCESDSGLCKIWCPGEPCNEAEHPDGCPQGVEACFVDASFTSYEEACKSCCESRYHEPTGQYACWDEGFSLCRYPTDCGLPLWP